MNNRKYSESLENYLETICLFGGDNVKSIDLAKHLNVSRASVNKAINTLKDKGIAHFEFEGGVDDAVKRALEGGQ